MTVRIAFGILVIASVPAHAQDGTSGHEGEIFLGPAEEAAAWSRQQSPGVTNAVPNQRRSDGTLCYWPDGIIPYVIDDGTPERENILRDIRTWDKETVLRFVERTPQHENWVRFTSGSLTDTSTPLCREGGIGEYIFLVNPGKSSFLHEIGHLIGMEHENQRRDRDRYLTVFRENIAETPLARSAWHSQPGYGPDTGVYDYRSIMHYGYIEPNKQRNHARPLAAETIPPGMPFGGTFEVSPGDADSVARMYGRIPDRHVISTNPSGLEIIVDGQRMTAPASFAWQPGSEHTLDVPSPQFRPGSRFLFGRWSDDGPRAHTITATGDTTLYQASFVAQHQVSTRALVCRRPYESCSREAGSVSISPTSPDGYYTLRTPIEVTATRPGAAVRFVGWNADTEHHFGFLKYRPVSNPARVVVTPGLTLEAHFAGGSLFRLESNIERVDVSIGDWWGTVPVAFDPDRFPNPVEVEPLLPDRSGTGYRHRFRSWSNGGDETHTIEVPQESDSTLTLTVDTEYRLNTLAWQDWLGNEILTTPSSDDGFYPEGTEVRLLASARPPATFIGWKGDVSGTDPAALVLMDDGKFAEAVFDLDATELQSDTPVEVSLSGLRWDDRVPDFERYYVRVPRGASKIEVEFHTRTATPAAGLFVRDTDVWPNWVWQDTADRALRAGEVATITIPRPRRRWPPAYFILVRAGESDSAARLEGTLVARVGAAKNRNRAPQAVRRLEDRTLATVDAPLVMDVAMAFFDPDGERLTYRAASSTETVAGASAWGSTVTITPVAAGAATITITASDVGGSNMTATQRFTVCVEPPGGAGGTACNGEGMPAFTDHPIRPGVTQVKAIHFTELRERIDLLRYRAGLAPFAWTDPVLIARVTPVSLSHLLDLREALTAAYRTSGRTAPVFTDMVPASGTTPIRAVHLMELRAAVIALE